MVKIERRKREHWTEFLDDRNNLWKAYAFTKTTKNGDGISVLRERTAKLTEGKQNDTRVLLTLFFPIPPQPVGRGSPSVEPRLVTSTAEDWSIMRARRCLSEANF